MSDLANKTTGERIKHFHNRVGMTRPVLSGLVGRSGEWAKAVDRCVPRRALSGAQLVGYRQGCTGSWCAWALTHALRDAGRWEEAVTVALDGARRLESWLSRTPDDDWRGETRCSRSADGPVSSCNTSEYRRYPGR
jgi:hypothetical protein